MLGGEDDALGAIEVEAAQVEWRHAGPHQQGGEPFVLPRRRARHVDGVVEEQGELLGIVEVGHALVGELDQFVEMALVVVAAMRLPVVQPGRFEQGGVAEQAHQSTSVFLIVSNTLSNIGVVSRPVFVL